MAAVPTLLRRVLVAAMPDADWSASQVAPTTGLISTDGIEIVGCFYVARDAAGAVVNPSWNCDLQPILVAVENPLPGHVAETLVRAGAADTGVVAGQALTYGDLGGASQFTLRVASGAALAGGVVMIDIYWNVIV